MSQQRQTYLTPEGRDKLQGELNHLRTVRRKEVAARIHKASETGGMVDNAEYDEAKNEQGFVEGRITDLDNILSKAIVAPTPKKKKGPVELGSTVTVVSNGGAKQNYMVVGSAEAAPLEGKISIESPVGRAILGRKKGDTVDVETPSGVVNLTITKVG